MLTEVGRVRYFPLLAFVIVLGVVQLALAAWRFQAWPHDVAASTGVSTSMGDGEGIDSSQVDAFVTGNLQRMGYGYRKH